MSNAYADRLAQVNEVQDVVAAEDICNAQGQIIVKKGAKIDRATAERVARFKLMRPVEDSVLIENELDANSLHECFDVFLQSDPSTAFLYNIHNTPEHLARCCKALCNHPLLRQKITVISLLMPEIFEQAMFCAWFSLVIHRSLERTQLQDEELFIAAMCHDVGMVHIDPEILNQQAELSSEQVRQLHSHPVIGFNILKACQRVHNKVAQVILDHHENLDGTGYPRGLSGDQISPEAQLLNMLDSVNAINNKHFKPFQRSMRDLVPIVQINQNSRFGAAGKVMLLLLKPVPNSTNHVMSASAFEQVVNAIRQRIGYIGRCMDIADEMSQAIGFRHQEKRLNQLQNAVIHINLLTTQSGFLNPDYLNWLDQVASPVQIETAREVEEAFLIVQEIAYHIDKLKRQIQSYLDNHAAGKTVELLKPVIAQLLALKTPTVNDGESDLWLLNFG